VLAGHKVSERFLKMTASVQGFIGGSCLGMGLALVHAVLSFSAWHSLGFNAPWLQLTSRVVLMLLLAGCILLLLPALCSLLFRAARRAGVTILAGLVSVAAGAVCGLYADHAIQKHGESTVVSRGVPIVHAIARYEVDNGQPPGGLHQLVPKYVDGIPPTGFVTFPRFEYQRSTRTGRWRLSARIEEVSLAYLCFEPHDPPGVPIGDHANAWVREVDDGCVAGAVSHSPS
jgi:hypothetical protein